MSEEQTVDQAMETLETSVEKSFTQDDLNRVGTKEHASGYSKALKDLGFEDVNKAKEALNAYAKWQDEQKSEVEKQTELLATKDAELEKAVANNRLLESKVAALSNGVVADSIDDVIALAERLVNDETSIDQAIKQVIEKYPQFVAVPTEEKEQQPKFIIGGNPAIQKETGNDPFEAIINNYGKN